VTHVSCDSTCPSSFYICQLSERKQDREIERMFSLRNQTSTDYGVVSQLSKLRVALHDCSLLLVWRN